MRIGIDFGGTNIKFGLFEEDGTEFAFEEVKVSGFSDKENFLQELLKYAQSFSGQNKLTSGGLAVKGLVDTDKGILHSDIGIGDVLAHINLKDIFSSRLKIPFIIENDARSYMLGEWQFGAGKNAKALACMTLGTGIGSAIIVDGKPYRGAEPTGGLLGGHLSINHKGPQCPCGLRGCLELYCSATSLGNIVKQNYSEFEQYKEPLPLFFKELDSGNNKYQPVFEDFLDNLAVGVVNIIHAFNPELVVLGGGVMQSAHLILSGLQNRVDKMAWTQPRGRVKVKAASLGNRAAALGVAFHPELKI